jgi:putative heme-binding domain-containing protein
LKLIAAKREIVLSGPPDLEAGQRVARATCFVCHRFYGEGAEVGPDLTGVGRSSLDALLRNVIVPNEVVGHGYENTEIELKDGTVLSGRVVEDTPSRIKLVASGPVEHLVARADLAMDDGKPRIHTSALSLMPEGLEQLPDADFRNLIWYLLNPPQDGRPLTAERYRELIGTEPPPL